MAEKTIVIDVGALHEVLSQRNATIADQRSKQADWEHNTEQAWKPHIAMVLAAEAVFLETVDRLSKELGVSIRGNLEKWNRGDLTESYYRVKCLIDESDRNGLYVNAIRIKADVVFLETMTYYWDSGRTRRWLDDHHCGACCIAGVPDHHVVEIDRAIGTVFQVDVDTRTELA